MATIKSYTDISQSKTLSKILSLESSDMYYWCADHYPKEDWIIEVGAPDDNYECICAWSLAALLGVLPYGYSSILIKSFNGEDYCCEIDGKPFNSNADNPVDACYKMIVKLNELKML